MSGAITSIPHAFMAGHTDKFYLHLQGKSFAEIAFFWEHGWHQIFVYITYFPFSSFLIFFSYQKCFDVSFPSSSSVLLLTSCSTSFIVNSLCLFFFFSSCHVSAAAAYHSQGSTAPRCKLLTAIKKYVRKSYSYYMTFNPSFMKINYKLLGWTGKFMQAWW